MKKSRSSVSSGSLRNKLISLVIFFMSSGVWAQEIGNQQVSVELNREPISKLLAAIENQTSFSTIISKQLIDDLGNITKSYDTNLQAILKDLKFNYNLDFQINNSSISFREISSEIEQTQRSLAGRVYDASTKEPLIGATVIISNTTTGTITDYNGEFEFQYDDDRKPISVSASFIGYELKIIPLSVGQTILTIALEPSLSELNEVIVVGYGTQNTASISGAVVSIESKSIKDIPVSSIDQALAGQMAGVQITQNSGSPGQGANIDIRGISTLTAGSQPLIVVDGMPLSTGNSNINFINPSEVESVSVLKDAASAAIYGSRGANGVILITTKRGAIGEPKFTVNSYAGVQQITKKVEVMDAYQRAQFIATARNNSWVESDPENNSATDPATRRPPNLRIPDEMLPYLEGQRGLTNIDWQDEILRDAIIQSHEITVNGGTEGVKYFVSSSYFDQEGIVVNSGFTRYALRMNLDVKLSDKLNLDVNLSPSFATRDLISESDHKDDGVIFTALLANPMVPARNIDGSLNLSDQIEFANRTGLTPTENPLALALVPSNTFRRSRLLGSTALTFRPVDGLELKTYFGADLTNSKEHYFKPSVLGSYGVPAPNQPLSRDESEDNINWIIENTAKYKLPLAEIHDFNILVGQSFQRETDEYLSAFGNDFPNDFIETANGALNTTGYSFVSSRALLSYFGRINYEFDQKYIVSLSLRSDGFSAFGKNNRWSKFPAISGAWRVSEESFFGTGGFVSDLKVRGSWGIAGNNQIPDFGGLALLQQANSVQDGQVVSGFSSSSSPNSNLSWEETETINIGLDLALFGGKITFTTDVFEATTRGLLLNVPVPGHSGYTRSLQNIGKIQNRGFEAVLGLKNHFGDLYVSSNVNFSIARNEVVSLGPDQEQIAELLHITKIGEPIGSYYGYQVLGVFRNEEQLNNTPHDPRAEVGSYIYKDINDDGEITDQDRALIGNFFPDYTFGFSTQLEYKNWDFSVIVQGKQGYEIFNGMSFFLLNEEGWGNASSRVFGNYFIEEGNPENPTYAKPRKSPTDKLYEKSDLMVEDGSYVRIRNIAIGYTFKKNQFGWLPVDQFRMYASSNNPFTFTKYSGFNPEVSSNNTSWNRNPTTPGVDYGAYPLARTIVVGLNINF